MANCFLLKYGFTTICSSNTKCTKGHLSTLQYKAGSWSGRSQTFDSQSLF